jgi:hypothetical protein
LSFQGFAILQPNATALKGLISEHDLNCAVSAPNALYGTRYLQDKMMLPQIQLTNQSTYTSFALKSMYIKPLDMPPFSHATVRLEASRIGGEQLQWSVDFPNGFHDTFQIRIEEFSRTSWSKLSSLQITADFVNGDQLMDWEFCLDDLEIELEI